MNVRTMGLRLEKDSTLDILQVLRKQGSCDGCNDIHQAFPQVCTSSPLKYETRKCINR